MKRAKRTSSSVSTCACEGAGKDECGCRASISIETCWDKGISEARAQCKQRTNSSTAQKGKNMRPMAVFRGSLPSIVIPPGEASFQICITVQKCKGATHSMSQGSSAHKQEVVRLLNCTLRPDI
eukprot:1159129-Pelagomonas_calceolata.AAC.2